MDKLKEIRLLDVSSPDLRYWLDAQINETGDLVLEGYDIGGIVENFWGNDDYEYWLTVAGEFKDSLLLLLIKDAFDSGHFENSSGFREWLDKKGVPNDFSSWT